MRHGVVVAVALLGGLGASFVASATQVVATGTVTQLQQNTTADGYTAGTFSFQLSGQPSVPACGTRGGWFVVSSNSISDAQTRINIFALLLTASTAGTQVSVLYDNAGALCDQTGIAVYYVNTP